MPTRSHFIPSCLLPLASCLFIKCAQMQIPTGGPKDVAPPRAIAYLPDSAATNFTSKTIRITFDEFVILKDVQGNLVISPPLEKQPEIKLVKNRILEIEFKEQLKANTTYSLNFGNAIADIHEGKIAEGFSYIFSTGNYIDTIALSGTVQDAFTQGQEKNAVVMLYSMNEDSLPYKRMPDYFAKTGSDGSYSIRHIKPGKYKVFALIDANRNFLFDTEEEKIGFSDTMVDLTRNRKLNMKVFSEEKRKQFVKKAVSVEPGIALVVFNCPLNQHTIRFIKEGPAVRDFNRNYGLDSTWIFHYDTEQDSIHLEFFSMQGMRRDTVQIRLPKGLKMQLRSKITFSGSGVTQDLDKGIKLEFNFPIHYLDIKGILYSGKNGVPIPLDSTWFSVPNGTRKLFLKRPVSDQWKEDQEYSVTILPGSFMGKAGLLSDTIKIKFKTPEQKYYGSLKLEVKPGKGNFIYQLLDEKGGIVVTSTMKGDQQFSYPLLSPGKYRVRLIEDSNGNGRWDTGNYLKKLQPEKVIYSPGYYNVRSDWDVEEVWKIAN